MSSSAGCARNPQSAERTADRQARCQASLAGKGIASVTGTLDPDRSGARLACAGSAAAAPRSPRGRQAASNAVRSADHSRLSPFEAPALRADLRITDQRVCIIRRVCARARASYIWPMTTIDEIVENFALLDEWDDRYRYVIELGRTLAPLPRARHIEPTRCRAAPARSGWSRT